MYTKMDDRVINCWDKFNGVMSGQGYLLGINNPAVSSFCPNISIGTKAFKEDRYVPVISLKIFDNEVCIFVTDRNGNAFLDGNTAAIYDIDVNEDNCEETFDRMLSFVLEKYGSYGKENRLDFDMDEQNTEKIHFSHIESLPKKAKKSLNVEK